jgi:L-fucose isomerase-like protein
MNGLRLARIGKPSDWLVASTPDPEIVTSTWGPEVIDIPMDEVVEAMGSVSNADASAIRTEVAGSARAVVEPSAGDLDAAARVAAALRQVVDRHRVDACTIRCFDLVVNQRTTGCLALSRLSDEGVTAGCEGDVPATLTMMWMRALTGAPAFVANPQDLDPATNTLWLAHCTVPRSLVSGYVLRSHFESALGVGIQGRFQPGPATVARIGGGDLRDVFVSDARIVESGDNPRRCRTQVEVRLQSDVRALLDSPVGNHHVLALGHLGETLREYHALFVAKAG